MVTPALGGPGKPAPGAAKVGAGGGNATSGPLAAAYGNLAGAVPGAGVDRVDRVTLTAGRVVPASGAEAASAKRDARVAGLVAGVVSAPVDTQNQKRRAGEAIPLHGSAAGRNEAATNIARHAGLGGLIDVKG